MQVEKIIRTTDEGRTRSVEVAERATLDPVFDNIAELFVEVSIVWVCVLGRSVTEYDVS